MIFSIRISFFGPTKCHCSQIVTLTGVTVNGEACTRCPTPMLNLNKNETNQSGKLSYNKYVIMLKHPAEEKAERERERERDG